MKMLEIIRNRFSFVNIRSVSILIFAVAMTWLLVVVRGAGPYSSLEIEDTAVSSPAAVKADPLASGGSFVSFSSTVLPDPNPGYFGPGLFFNDNNANLPIRRVGSTEFKVLQSFRAPKSGNLTGVRAYLVGNPGYASGSGGKLEINIWPTNNSDPLRPVRSGTPLSTTQYQLNYSNGYPPSFTATWPLISLTANQPLTAGELYYVEFKNVDPDPVNNWVSVNAVTALKEHQTVAYHLPISDWSITWEAINGGSSTYYDSSKSLYPGTLDPDLHYFPSTEYKYQDGTFFGNVRLEPGNWGSYPHDINSSNPVRERFQIQDGTTITGAEIHTAAKVAGELRVHFKLNGSTVTTATLSEQSPTFYT
ncbi:MAG: hypothetical protein R3313_01490, partial [Candidatus Saccharimonadales bacterium]|nr:hypothetical protein [Candidatus Saccharimonadales bacterium]